ncbi:unnamed protein product [Chrysodeixis includens]|uniref:DUF7869 domain-containing protein n=1 Tax=Chrysodeixis includens TaxID=689277 RepID=A0A9P0FR87_CHRIL|nr:unnamed protein product [Chrysodeixis includens]
MCLHISISLCISAEATALAYNVAQQHDDVESPMAPLFSPLTPLVTVREAILKETDVGVSVLIEENPSPIRSMTPETFEIYQTLSNKAESPLPFRDHQKQISDIISDTDSDYIPNSDEEFSDKDIPARSGKISVVAVVHGIDENNKENNNIATVSDIDAREPDELTQSREEFIDNSGNLEKLDEAERENNKIWEGRPKKGRKRKFQEYTLRQRKERKYANLSYQGKTKFVEPVVFKDYACTCRKQCHQLISKEQREQEFNKYVALTSYEAQLLFIVNCVKETSKKRTYTVITGNVTKKNKPRQYKRTYSINSIEVCRDMFVNNFQISPKKIDISLRKNRDGKLIKDQRGYSVGGWNKTSEEDVEFVKNLINSLPKYESHYRREQNSSCQYLKLGMTIQKIYELYLEKSNEVYGKTKAPVSFSKLKNIFYKDFNLRCKALKKDTCSRCDAFNNKIKTSTGEEQAKLNEEKMKHLKRAEDLRNDMNKDLMQAKTDENFECLTYDLEKTLPLPRIPTSIIFYKRQLWMYNCGIHAGSDNNGHCYVWIEGEAGRGAQEVGSCLIKYIKTKLNPKVQNLVLWSDCCGGQNRNIKIVLMLRATLNSHQTLKTITLKYLESGHTFLPNDTDFSKIEAQLKYHERIYTADEYIAVIKKSKKKNPLQVQRMEKKDFFSTKKIEKNIVNRKVFLDKTKVNWLITKEILIKKEEKFVIFMKTQNEEKFKELNIEKKIKGKSLEISDNDFTLLWPNGKEIPQPKLDDLKSIFDFIPKDCLDFYKSLRGNPSLHDDIDGFGGEPDFAQEQE